jgi:hypothetical protein
MKVIRILYVLLVIGVFSSCGNSMRLSEEIELVSDSLGLTNSVIEFKSVIDSRNKKKNTIHFKFESSEKMNDLYYRDPRYLIGKLAFCIYNIIGIEFIDDYFSIEIKGIINGEIKEKIFQINELKFFQESINSANKISNFLDVKDFKNVREGTRESDISNSVILDLFNGIDSISNCGERENIELLGVDVTENLATGERIVLIKHIVNTKGSFEIRTFYVVIETQKVIFCSVETDC